MLISMILCFIAGFFLHKVSEFFEKKVQEIEEDRERLQVSLAIEMMIEDLKDLTEQIQSNEKREKILIQIEGMDKNFHNVDHCLHKIKQILSDQNQVERSK